MPGKTVTVDRIDVGDAGAQLGVVTMNRPDEMNPIDWDTGLALGQAFDELASDERIRVVAVTGAGRAFSAGGDMKKYQLLQRDRRDFPRFLADLHEVFSRISGYPQPFVALVNGVAVAGGLELLLSCDLAIAAASARIGDAHQAFGQMGGGGVLTLLPRTVGPARARELIFSGRMLSPDEAADWGLVSSVVGVITPILAGRVVDTIVARGVAAVASASVFGLAAGIAALAVIEAVNGLGTQGLCSRGP